MFFSFLVLSFFLSFSSSKQSSICPRWPLPTILSLSQVATPHNLVFIFVPSKTNPFFLVSNISHFMNKAFFAHPHPHVPTFPCSLCLFLPLFSFSTYVSRGGQPLFLFHPPQRMLPFLTNPLFFLQWIHF